MKTLHTTIKLGALIALMAIGAVWASSKTTRAVDSFTNYFGMVGITTGQTARLNLVCVGTPDTHPIKAELSFVDGDDNTLSRSIIVIDAGKASSLDLSGSEVIRRVGNRTQIRAVVRFVGTPDTRVMDDYIATLEIFDNDTGETRILLPAVQKVQKVQ